MAVCKNCGNPFNWGQDEQGRWILLEPRSRDAGMPRKYVDSDGALRADHRDRCGGGGITPVRKLEAPIPDVTTERCTCPPIQSGCRRDPRCPIHGDGRTY